MSAAALASLTHALSIVLPTPEETSLLRACLWTGEAARRAWASYRERAGDMHTRLARDRRGLKRLMPLLLQARRRSGLDVDEALLTVLRTAHLRAALRAKTVRQIVHDVLEALTTARLPHIVLDGTALAETVYAEPALRHCTALELLLRADDLSRAARRLSALAAAPLDPDGAPSADALAFSHESGFPIELRSRLVLNRDHAISIEELFAASRMATISGVPTRILSPPDCLLDLCLKAFFDGRRAGLGWVPDAWHVLHRSADVDWDLLLERLREGHLALLLLIPLGYLAQALEAPIPAPVLEEIREAAARTDPVRGERALAAAVAGTPGAIPRLLAMRGGWGSRLVVAKWMVCPSRSYLRLNYELSRSWQVPFYYLYRPLRFVTRRLAASGR